MCGTLKNIVALAAGLVDGLGYGANTKSAMLRQGMKEMRRFAQARLAGCMTYSAIRSNTLGHARFFLLLSE